MMSDNIKKIVVGVDESEPSRWALSVASDLALALHADITLVHVFIPPVAGVSEIPIPVDEILERQRSDSVALLEAARQKLPPSLLARTVVGEGSPPREIIALAEQIGASFIVLGTHGRGRLATFFMGSTTEAVIRGAPCPVVAVSHEPKQASRVAPGVGSVSHTAASTVREGAPNAAVM